MARMDRWTHPSLATRAPILDPNLMDGLESMGDMGVWAEVLGAGLDFLGKKKELEVQEDALKVQLQAAQKAKEVAQLQLAAAQAQRETAALEAAADKKRAEAKVAGFGLDVGGMMMPVLLAGAVAVMFFMQRGRRRRR